MNLANPLALALAALAVPIVVFYILKVRLRRVPVSTLMFWSQIYEEKRPRTLWQQLRHLLSLLLQLLFLALLVMALADPFWSWELLQARRVVLVVDNSASMNATDAATPRLEAARVVGRRLIQGLRARDQMAIVSAGGSPKVACGLTGHQRTLLDALEGIARSDSSTQVSAAVELSRRLLAGHENAQISVLTDGCFPQAEELLAAKDVNTVLVGQKTGNVGLTQFQTRRSLVDSIGYQILIEVQNFSDEPVECSLEIDLNDSPVDVLPLQLAAGERWSRTLDQTSAEGGRLVARLQHADALAADNRSVAILPHRQRQRVLLVTAGSLFLTRVLQAIPTVDLQVVSVPPAEVPPGVVVVYHRQVPENLPAANVLAIDPASSSEAWTLGPELENPLVGKQQTDSQLLTHVRLDNVWMPAAKKLEFKDPHDVLIASVAGEAMYISQERKGASGNHKLLVLSVDLEKGDLPLRTAFPIMITNAMSWFQGQQGELREAIAAGQTVEVDLQGLSTDKQAPQRSGQAAAVEPSTSTQSTADLALVLRSPAGKLHPLPKSQGKLTVGPLDECGVWSIEPAAPANAAAQTTPPSPLVELACNLSNAAESDLRRAAELSTKQSADSRALVGRPIWYYLALLATVLICVEWWLYQRRWIS